MKKNKLYLEWILRAQDDEKSAEILLKEDGTPNTICFLSQQMAEKCLKAFLVYHNHKFPKIHQLDSLINLCIKIDSEFNKLKSEAKYLTTFYVTTRYPGDYPVFSFNEAKKAFEMASKIKKIVTDKILT